MKRIGFFLIAVLAVVLGLVVGALNAEAARLDLLWFQLEWPLGLLMLTAFVAGILVAAVSMYFVTLLPLRMRLRSLNARARTAASPVSPTPDE